MFNRQSSLNTTKQLRDKTTCKKISVVKIKGKIFNKAFSTSEKYGEINEVVIPFKRDMQERKTIFICTILTCQR